MYGFKPIEFEDIHLISENILENRIYLISNMKQRSGPNKLKDADTRSQCIGT